MKLEEKNYEKDINFEQLEKKIKGLNVQSNAPHFGTDDNQNTNKYPFVFFGNKFNSEQQNFLSDRNHNAKPMPKENVRYSQMTMQEAEETFAQRYLPKSQKL
jgi:hypothetical protein